MIHWTEAVMKLNIVFDLLMRIENRKELYIGNGDLLSLKHFIDGFCACAMEHDIDYGDQELRNFDTYVHDACMDNRTVSLFQAIVDCTKNEKESFELFYTLLHQYIKLTTDNSPERT